MKKLIKLVIICAILLSVIVATSTISFAVEGTMNVDSIIEDIQDEQASPTETTATPEDTTPITTPETTTETTTTPASEKIEETKLPQTGDAENLIIISAVVIFVVLAIYASRKIKKFNVK